MQFNGTFLVPCLALAALVGAVAFATRASAEDGRPSVAKASDDGGDDDGDGDGDNNGGGDSGGGGGDGGGTAEYAVAAACPTIYQAPDAYRRNYEAVSVLLDSMVTVNLDPVRYLNADPKRGDPQGTRGLKMYNALYGLGAANPGIQAAFNGTGSTTDVGAALKAVWDNWEALEKQGLLQARYGQPEVDLPRVYEAYLGLDCSGFAGNWARANGSALGPDKPVTDWAANSRASFQRKSLAAVCPGDVIQYKNAGHVAVIAEVDRANGRVLVVESCAEGGCVGLQSEWHTIRHDGGGLFTVQQTSRARTDHPAYIAPVL